MWPVVHLEMWIVRVLDVTFLHFLFHSGHPSLWEAILRSVVAAIIGAFLPPAFPSLRSKAHEAKYWMNFLFFTHQKAALMLLRWMHEQAGYVCLQILLCDGSEHLGGVILRFRDDTPFLLMLNPVNLLVLRVFIQVDECNETSMKKIPVLVCVWTALPMRFDHVDLMKSKRHEFVWLFDNRGHALDVYIYLVSCVGVRIVFQSHNTSGAARLRLALSFSFSGTARCVWATVGTHKLYQIK